MRRYLILIVLLLIPLIPLGLFALGVIKPKQLAPTPVTLTAWITSDTPQSFQALLNEYKNLRPYITVNLTQIDRTNYAAVLKDAWARGRGPDVFELPASWVTEFANDFLAPLPPSTNVYTYFSRKLFFRTEVEIKKTAIPSVTASQLQREFVETVAPDVIRDGYIYGLPLSFDTLVLYYNKDIFQGNNIIDPPRTWEQLTKIAPRLSLADSSGRIISSAIALGTGANVNHAADIMSLLFLQDGVTMNTGDGGVLLDESIASDGTNLGVNALTFYTSFADPNRDVYSWNKDMPNSLEAFLTGKTAMYIGYASDRTSIESAGSVNFGVAPIPHLQEDGKDALYTSAGRPLQVNYGNYLVFSVFQRTAHPHEAWNFAQFLTRDERLAGTYLAGAQRIAALRSLLARQQGDDSLRVFAEQAISARTWYRGRSATATEQYLRDMIDNAASKRLTVPEALARARAQIETTTKELR